MTPAVLVVDDLPFMRSLLCDIVRAGDMSVAATASDGHQALTAYLANAPDIVLLDIAMPGMDGILALKKLREIDPGARVIMCSALGEQAMIIRAIQLGARDFVVKPFHPERVLTAITRVLEADGLLDGGPYGSG